MTAKDFFLTELPPLLAAIKAKYVLPKVTYDVEFEIEGDGMFTVAVKDGDAAVRRGGAPSPLVAMSFAKKTWDEALSTVIRPRLGQLAERDAGQVTAEAEQALGRHFLGKKPVAPEKAVQVLQGSPLYMELVVEPVDGHRFVLKLAGAEEDDDKLTVQLKRSDLDALLAGQLLPEQAFKEQRLKVKGAMPQLMALISRLVP